MFILLVQTVYSQKFDTQKYSSSDNITDVSIRIVWPQLYYPELMIFANIGYGFNFPVMRNFFSVGFYIDAGVGADWLALFSNDNYNNYEYGRDRSKIYNQFGANIGLRAYSLIELGIMNFTFFAGYSAIFGQLDRRAPAIIHNPVAGASLIFKWIGLEYCWYIPVYQPANVMFHHISIVFRAGELF